MLKARPGEPGGTTLASDSEGWVKALSGSLDPSVCAQADKQILSAGDYKHLPERVELMPHARRTPSWLLAGISVAGLLAAAPSPVSAGELDQPTFRKGLWSFNRTIEHIHGPDKRNTLLHKEQMMRCVDPSVAMKLIFASPPIGKCSSSKPVRIDNRYVFAVRCDYMGPVRTEIIVDSDAAYTEMNLLTVGAMPRRDTVMARRLGDCDRAAARPGPPEINTVAASEPVGHQLAIEQPEPR
jgi:hypothetical protein